MSIKERIRANVQGRMAWEAGEPLTANPYIKQQHPVSHQPTGNVLADAWNRGWRERSYDHDIACAQAWGRL
jgi:hypothetical protein